MAYDPKLYASDHLESAQIDHDGRQSQLHTGMPGHIVAVNMAKMTATVQPAIQGVRTMLDGSQQNVTIAPIQDVPITFPGGGGHVLTFPVAAGDECWIAFSERSIDNWFQHGGIVQPSDWRMHDITDAVCLVGLRSQAGLPQGGADPHIVQLRSDDGQTVVTVDGPNHKVSMQTGNPFSQVLVDGANQAVTVFAGGTVQTEVYVDGKTGTVQISAPNVQVGSAGGNFSVLGVPPIPRATITGSTGGIQALKDLLQFLQLRGDILDDTT